MKGNIYENLEYGDVTVNVEAVLQDVTINAEIGATTTIDLTAVLPINFSEVITVTQPAYGVSSYDSATKQLSYTPNSSATSDSFTYAANGCAKTITANVSRPPALLALNTPEKGNELWKTDGTVAGTELVKDINPGTANSNPDSFVKRSSDGVYFFKATNTHGEVEIWKTDGTASNTNVVKSIPVEHYSGFGGHFSDLLLVGDDVFFYTKTSTTFKIWKSNGTEAGTVLVETLPTLGGSASGYANTINSKLIFNYDYRSQSGGEAWVSNGTDNATILADIWPGGGDSDFMKGSVVEFKGKLFSRADDGSSNYGSEIWMTDGTSVGTELLIDLEPGTEGSIPTNLTVAGDVFYFTAVTRDKHDQLWKSDGTENGTVAVKDMDPSSTKRDMDLFSSDFFYGRVKQGDEIKELLFFAAKNGEYGIELWKSDGTEAGTVMVKDLMAGTNYSSRPGDFVELNGVVYFSAYAIDNSRNLWRTDGTEAGTYMVKSFGIDQLQPGSIEVKNGIMLLTLRMGGGESGFDNQIWRSDGTELGTYFLGDML